jgi:hypothetical protein
MTQRNFLAAGGSALAAAAAALSLTFSTSAALAASNAHNWFKCEAYAPSKASPMLTHCVTWTRDANGRMQAHCDPAKMSDAAMRARCAEMSTHPDRMGAPAA